MALVACEFPLAVLLCVLLESAQPLSNDATELRASSLEDPMRERADNASLNRARSGGRRGGDSLRGEDGPLGCKELRSTRYISDGRCTSPNPVKELVCAGECVPVRVLPNWIGGGYGGKFWARRGGRQRRCVTDRTRVQRVHLLCPDGSTRSYRVRVVTSCKCKRCSRQHNESGQRPQEAAPSRPQRSKVRQKEPKPKSSHHGNRREDATDKWRAAVMEHE
ncbi:sclerostin domain-containing protein 1-like [Scleropages formosus]|uniref:Sclerostin domain-containing protein 1-like n=1 Tax=Scleropages formosus TaxID=113540 RepID=A0A0P7WB89_SCLFO|nr:sclerostin domain-containing protein 1-like [Scleropages formosus]